jgi:hypothetical protein
MGIGDQIPREGRIAVTLTCARGLPDTRGRLRTRPAPPARQFHTGTGEEGETKGED